MKEDKLVICRLCLSLIEDGSYAFVDDVKREMLRVLLPNLKADITSDPVLCNCCTTQLQKSYDFKTDYLNYFHNVKMEIKEEEYQVKCMFCCIVKDKLISIEEDILLREMLERCLSEVNICEKTSVCGICLEPLQSQYNFITKCLEIEEQLASYSSKIGNSHQINLFNVLHLQNIKKCYNNTAGVDDTERVIIKRENEDSYEPILEECDKIDCSNIKTENCIGEEDIEIKSDKEDDVTLSKNTSERKVYKCDLCEYQTYRKTDLTLRHILRHKKPDEVTMFKCTECSYQSKRRGDLNSHLATHFDSVPVYKCQNCHYKTIHQSRLEDHVAKHNLPEKYKCEHCSFKATYKKSLVKHIRSHKRREKRKVYQCELCPYETKRRTDLTDKHMLTHKRPDEVVMHKCQYCEFQAKHKCSLNRHTLKHQSPQETVFYECTQCNFKAKQKRYLTAHAITHKNPEEVIMYKCDLCPYEAKLKAYLRKHKTTHQNLGQTTFNCEMCSYETNTKSNLQRHLKRHDPQMDGLEPS